MRGHGEGYDDDGGHADHEREVHRPRRRLCRVWGAAVRSGWRCGGGWLGGRQWARGWYRTGACAEKLHAVHAHCHQQGTAEKEHQVEYGVGNGDSKLSLSSPSHAKPHRRACRTASARSTSCEVDGGLQLSQGEVSRSCRGDGTAEGRRKAGLNSGVNDSCGLPVCVQLLLAD